MNEETGDHARRRGAACGVRNQSAATADGTGCGGRSQQPAVRSGLPRPGGKRRPVRNPGEPDGAADVGQSGGAQFCEPDDRRPHADGPGDGGRGAVRRNRPAAAGDPARAASGAEPAERGRAELRRGLSRCADHRAPGSARADAELCRQRRRPGASHGRAAGDSDGPDAPCPGAAAESRAGCRRPRRRWLRGTRANAARLQTAEVPPPRFRRSAAPRCRGSGGRSSPC